MITGSICRQVLIYMLKSECIAQQNELLIKFFRMVLHGHCYWLGVVSFLKAQTSTEYIWEPTKGLRGRGG